MQDEHVNLVAENERLQREVFTKEQLLLSQESMNKRNINKLKSDYAELEIKLQIETEKHKMSYEDLRSLADVSFRRIKKLEAIEKYLRDCLDKEIALKNRYNRLL